MDTIRINKYTLLICLITIFKLTAIAQSNQKTLIKTYYDDWAGIVAEEFYVIDGDSNRIDGEYKRYFPGSDNLIVKSTYKDGVLNGPFFEYFENGRVHFKANYKNGLKQGAYTSYYVEGMKKTEAQFKADKMVGTMKKYFPTGVVQIEHNIKANIWKEFYPSGKIMSTSEMEGELRNGSTTVYDEEGNIKQKGNYVEGKIDGIYYTYFPKSESLQKESAFVLGELQGESKEYYISGQVKLLIPFDHNLEHGLRIEYYESGQEMSENKMVEGKSTGNYKNYYENGQLKSEMITALGKEQKGVFREYAEDGTLLKEGHMQQGKMHGVTKVFYATGNLKQEFNYQKGIKKGNQQLFYEDGKNLKQLEVYAKNATEVAYKAYFENGKISEEGQFTKKQKSGPWKTYYNDGQLKMTKTFVNGFEEGDAMIYNHKGALLTKEKYRKGRLVGIRIEYFDDGKTVLMETPYDKGYIYGVVKKYYRNGQIREIGKKYKEKKLDTWKYFDENGLLEKEEIYNKGTLLEVKYPNE
ncbi:toxin-antitoxin system YwqK family antitoxin [Flammeovirga sp. SubArs3]|uniref:toxin-antitoxin system YwqK family antitoxin n=1 Tax=Flammeovirga sp. SubArs3 TaxID=2995316 RepID=UPI00248BADE9|nr:toxin-antitoxin system YwqK family antitoxin [Flammeovirga sp. SubArs3]